jgi:DNA-binding IclR family transcriptional regulator
MRKRSENLSSKSDPAQNSAASLVRGLEILRCFRPGDSSLGNQDIIERTGLPKATASRLCAALVDLGYLHYDQQLGRYSIGAATVSLGYSALTSSAVVHLAQPLMQDLSERTGTSVALGTRERGDMVYLASWRSFSPVALRLNVGSRLPMLKTGMGLAYLAELNELEFEALCESLREQHDALCRARETALEEMGKFGFVTAYGTWYSYINTIGVALRPTDGSPLVAVTCGAISDILSRERCHNEIGPLLRDLVDCLRARLGGNPDPSPGLFRRQ